jgi:hypothetical protein
MQEALKVVVLQWLLRDQALQAFHPSLSANSNRLGAADKDAIMRRAFSAFAGAEPASAAPIAP